MNLYFDMTHPNSERLIAEVKNSYGEGRNCTVTTEHRGGFPRIGPLLRSSTTAAMNRLFVDGGILSFMKPFGRIRERRLY